MSSPNPLPPRGTSGALRRQNAGFVAFVAVTGGLLWYLRSRSEARKPFEEKQTKMEDKIDRNPGSTMGRSISERDPTTR